MLITLESFLSEQAVPDTTWYHGTPNRHFRDFRLDMEISNQTIGGLNDSGLGVFLTDNKTMAGWFAGVAKYDMNKEAYALTGNLGNIAEVEVSCKNAFLAGTGEDGLHDYSDVIDSHGGTANFRQWLLDEGYDSVILTDLDRQYYADGTYDILVVLDPTAAKIYRWLGTDEYL